jgi:hypothetical protein
MPPHWLENDRYSFVAILYVEHEDARILVRSIYVVIEQQWSLFQPHRWYHAEGCSGW